MKPPVLTVDDARDPAAEQVIAEGLRRYNREQCGISDGRALTVVARDPETNAPLGGITGHTSLGVLFIDLFFLPEELRRGGVGRRLLQLAEDEGRRRGCATVLACPRCGGRLRLIATVEDPEAIRAILAALAISRARADRAPPFAASLDTSPAATISA